MKNTSFLPMTGLLQVRTQVMISHNTCPAWFTRAVLRSRTPDELRCSLTLSRRTNDWTIRSPPLSSDTCSIERNRMGSRRRSRYSSMTRAEPCTPTLLALKVRKWTSPTELDHRRVSFFKSHELTPVQVETLVAYPSWKLWRWYTASGWISFSRHSYWDKHLQCRRNRRFSSSTDPISFSLRLAAASGKCWRKKVLPQ